MRQQSMRWAVTGTLGIVLALALTVMVNWVAARRWVQGDWTSSRVYSLSAKTLGILSELDQDIEVVVFMTPGSAFYEQVSVLLGRYEAASSHLHVEFIDPDREPLKTRQLAEQYGVSVADTVVFQYGDRSKYVTADQMASYDHSGMQMGGAPRLKAFKGEEQFTSAILSLVAPEVPPIGRIAE